jgi:pseudouridine synthase
MIVQKYLVAHGICSRKEGDRLLRAGLIYVNGKRAVPGRPLLPSDEVTIAEEGQKTLANKMTVAVYKPRGIMCSSAVTEGRNVFDVWPQYKGLNMVGRLDKESEALLLLSNDGLVTKKVTGNLHETEKEYEITTEEKVFNGKLEPFIKGMRLSDGYTLPAVIQILDKHTFRVIIREGRNRQIRRMCGQVNLNVLTLKRIRIGQLWLDDMRPGESRRLTTEEVDSLKQK